MRIAIFTELFTPSIGGQEMFFAGIGAALQKRGHALDVYCVGHMKDLPEKEILDGLTVARYPFAPNYKRPQMASAKRNWLAIFRYALRIRSVAARGEHDFYLLNQWPLLHVLMLPRRARRRALLQWCEVRQSHFYRECQKWLPHLVRLNAAISDAVAEQIRVASSREVMILPSGLDLTRNLPQGGEDRSDIVALGRIAEHKNLQFLVEAFEILKDGGYPGRLKIAGDGPGMPVLRARVEASPYGDEIDLLGFISEEKKFELLARCEILAMPSKREGFPFVISEAMWSGLPVVTADYPENGTKAVVTKFGLGVVTEPTEQAFADGVIKTLADWRTYSENGRAEAHKLDWNGIAERLELELNQVLGDRTV